MKSKILLVLIFILLLTSQIWASSTTIDGDFSDWYDKPYFDSKENDSQNISGLNKIYWFYDNTDNNIYFKLNIEKTKYKIKDEDNYRGEIQTIFKTDFGEFKAITEYNALDNMVTVTLYGDKSVKLWSNTTKSCIVDNDHNINIEFMLPIKYLVKDMQMGYLIKFKFISGIGECPSNSWFTFSTVSTNPYLSVTISLIAITSIVLIKKISVKRKSRCNA